MIETEKQQLYDAPVHRFLRTGEDRWFPTTGGSMCNAWRQSVGKYVVREMLRSTSRVFVSLSLQPQERRRLNGWHNTGGSVYLKCSLIGQNDFR